MPVDSATCECAAGWSGAKCDTAAAGWLGHRIKAKSDDDAIGFWRGPRVEVVQGSGLPAFKITNPQDNSTELLPLVYLVGGSPSLMGPKEPKLKMVAANGSDIMNLGTKNIACWGVEARRVFAGLREFL